MTTQTAQIGQRVSASSVKGLKEYRQGDGFTEFTTGTQTYSEEMQNGVEGEREIYRTTHATWMSKAKTVRVN